MFVGRWRGTSSVLAGACAVFFADTALAAGLGALAAAESPSLPLFAAFAAAASAGFGTVACRVANFAPRGLAGSTAGSVAPADSVLFMPVSAERSEELSGGATGAALRRVGLTVSVSRSCGSRFGAMLVSAALVAVTGTRGRGRREAGFRARGTGEVFFSFC